MKVFLKLKKLLLLPVSLKKRYMEHLWLLAKGALIYRFMFSEYGSRNIVHKPLFISCEAVKLESNVLIGPHARIEVIYNWRDTQYNPSILIGSGVHIEQRCHITAAALLRIGQGTTILFDVLITDIDHEYQNIEIPMSQQPLIVKETTIGENCFIGSGAKINAGTTLGKHCIVGANAVVRGDFPDYCVIVGIPAKIVKRYNLATQAWQKTNSLGDFV
ncbi:DapH/DapD/GlmU-related protein [Pseudoalteromonas sp. SR44-2]|uniref:acyltransferase n=1 Tax=Pseudoalteromonas sp. SR44-2 TaxID=2760937 RepID=UPI001C728402|nr:acyltransferase [Pseudoalteromonas sp. SR44-2]